MIYSVVTVANTLLEIASQHGRKLTPLKIQKLVYLAQGVALAISNGKRPLFRERIEAWQYGPVVPNLYDGVKRYGKDSITNRIELPLAHAFTQPTVIPEHDKWSWEILEATWTEYGSLSATQLVSLTHMEDAPEGYPWHEAWVIRHGKTREGTDISDHVMTESFQKIVSVREGA